MGLASKLTTRADLLVLAESAALPIGATLQSPNYRRKKAPFFRTRLLIMAGVERFELPTRGFGIRCSANWSYTPAVRF